MLAAVSPPLVPGFDATVVMVLDDFGRLGRAYRETREGEADMETVIGNMLTGQYERPVRVVEFNIAEGWCRDVSADVAREVADRARRDGHELPRGTLRFVEAELGDRIPAAD
jgi:hypothetical protein